MRVLALDTALEVCGAALYDAANRRILASEVLPMARGHAEALLPLVQRVMARAGMPRDGFDRVAATAGPGSFTGLRVGLSAARGLALAAGCPVVGVSSLSALAAPLMAGADTSPVAAMIDARHGRVYLHLFGPDGQTLEGPAIVAVPEAARLCAMAGARLVGPGAAMVAAVWPPQATRPPLVDPRPAPDLVWIAEIGAVADPASAPPRPLYLAPVDARPQDSHRLARA
jgi:tRNA threonylcarbamoyladenosine biosynthesis protein TsaB